MKKTALLVICLLITGLATVMAQDVAYNFTNKVTFTISGSRRITKFVAMMPLPQSNQYQDIYNLTYSGGVGIAERQYGNHVLLLVPLEQNA